ncbi:MAG: glutamine--tRNA ligase/YqeY domain fusion protein [Ectothiorhodospiraceae bacterium]|nr:glutamine--tRNA ligase/YqeY domain fusion protein [Ectothiorhodospiraceae bacterium]
MSEAVESRDFIRQIVADDIAAGRHGGRIVTRFPPEPNGYLHIGHAKAICLNFGIAEEFPDAQCFLRMDDTNPSKESQEFVDAIQRDVRWLGFDWGNHQTHASDYFERLYELAVRLVRAGDAYVDGSSAEEIRASRGTLTEPGRASPDRERSIEENLDLFARMRAGEFPDGRYVLRAKIDMASPNINLRDPVMYRIMHRPHQMTGDTWCIYPMYDWAHGQCDWLEGVTHSLCTLEFEDHRPLYDWFLDRLGASPRPRQYEFSRLNLTHFVMSKRVLSALVQEGHVRGWDDPRMPTIQGLRRRGYTPESIRDLCTRVGVTRKDNVVEMAVLESCVREDLDARAPRAMAVLAPLKLVITDYDAEREEWLAAANHPRRPELGERTVPFSRELWIERDDFALDPPPKFHRLAPGREVRLRYGYLVTCTDVVRDPATGAVLEVHCTHDPQSRGGNAPDGRKVKGTIHWLSARHAVSAEIRLYDRLFVDPNPMAAREGKALGELLNPDSMAIVADAMVEPSLAAAAPESRFQFERQGYFCADPDTTPERPVFNRTVTLRDTWAKVSRRD